MWTGEAQETSGMGLDLASICLIKDFSGEEAFQAEDDMSKGPEAGPSLAEGLAGPMWSQVTHLP